MPVSMLTTTLTQILKHTFFKHGEGIVSVNMTALIFTFLSVVLRIKKERKEGKRTEKERERETTIIKLLYPELPPTTLLFCFVF